MSVELDQNERAISGWIYIKKLNKRVTLELPLQNLEMVCLDSGLVRLR